MLKCEAPHTVPSKPKALSPSQPPSMPGQFGAFTLQTIVMSDITYLRDPEAGAVSWGPHLQRLVSHRSRGWYVRSGRGQEARLAGSLVGAFTGLLELKVAVGAGKRGSAEVS